MTREKQILKQLNRDFQYRTDKETEGFFDVWRWFRTETVTGDCEDYSLTLLYRLADRKVRRMMWWILTRRAKIMHYKHRERGTGHAALQFKHDNGDTLQADNISAVWDKGENLERHGYEHKFSWPLVGVIFKVLGSQVIAAVLWPFKRK